MRSSTVGLVVVAALVLVGCDKAEDSGSPTVVAAVYPLAWAAERIAGESATVVNLTPPGAEPHDAELTPRDVETLRDADLVLYVGGGFQPAIEEAVRDRGGRSFDVVRGEKDPHVWLDPVRFAKIVTEIGRLLGDSRRADSLAAELRHLDTDYGRGLERCTRRALVVTHAAFGHVAVRYGLRQVALAGRSPEAEPGARELERLVGEVRESGATTVFTEPLVSDRLAQTVARETAASVATLDPVEGLSDERLAAGADYLSVMRENLKALQEALGCR